jgi:hypothetical protein
MFLRKLLLRIRAYILFLYGNGYFPFRKEGFN